MKKTKAKKVKIHIDDFNKEVKKANLTPIGVVKSIVELHNNKTSLVAEDIKQILKSPYFKDLLYPSILKGKNYLQVMGKKYYFQVIENKNNIELLPISDELIRFMGFDTINKIASELSFM